jgi:hypothetical protein
VKKDVVIIARGRPGLGHVTPAVSVSKSLACIGVSSCIYSYDQGWLFLQSVKDIACYEIPVIKDYLDYPGLYSYDISSSFLRAIEEKHSPKMILLFGEYMLPRIKLKTCVFVGLVFNQEIFEASSSNIYYHPIFLDEFSYCDFLIQLGPKKEDIEYLPFPDVEVLGCGPFPLSCVESPVYKHSVTNKKTLLIGNGGGLSLPQFTSSYSSSSYLANKWSEESKEYTRALILAAVKYDNIGSILVYSSLPQKDNNALCCEFSYYKDIQISTISCQFYNDILRADIAISRCGLGFLNDVVFHDVPAAVWCLNNHLEQQKLVQSMSEQHRNILWLRSISSVDSCLKELCSLERVASPTKALQKSNRLFDMIKDRIGTVQRRVTEGGGNAELLN